MIRLVGLAAAVLVVAAVAALVLDVARSRLRGRIPKPTPRQRRYDWEPRTDRLARRAKGVPAPPEDRGRILSFLESRSGVEAFVEPRTVVHPLSVVLVDGDGDWIRVELRDDAYLRDLARTHGLRVHDASRVGYPERMRRRRDDPGREHRE